VRLAAVLKDRILKASAEEFRIYDGRARAALTVDGAGRAPRINAEIALQDVSGLPLLTDIADIDWLSGRVRLQLALAGQGASPRAMVESLAGNADVLFTDGAIVGFNLAQIVRGFVKGDRVTTEKTDFSELSASFAIGGGVARSENLRMQGPLLRVTGTGTVDVNQRQLDWALKTRLVPTLVGQGGARELAGLDVPVHLYGPWTDPEIDPDLDAVLKDPGKIVDAVKDFGKQLGGTDLGKMLDDLLGDDDEKPKSKRKR
jgi:AsmA protein